MSFTLPELPYAHDALQPYMSKETLEYHHDKHHLAYVNNGNNLLKGTEWEGKSLEEIVNETRAQVYLLDEWDANLDAANKAKADALVDELAARARVVEISHRDLPALA